MKICFIDRETYQIGLTSSYDYDLDLKIGGSITHNSKDWIIEKVEVENHYILVTLV